MRQLAASVDRFPASVDAQVSFSSGPSADFSYFSLHFSCIDGAGHVVLRVKIAEIIRWSNGRPTNNVVEFDVPVEPAAIDRFASALATISDAPIGTVTAELNAGP